MKKFFKVLYAASEVYPFIKTGGLADVASSLPRALKSLHIDVRIILPAYQDALIHAKQRRKIAQWQQTASGESISLWENRLPQSLVKVWFVDHPLYRREGGPYSDADGKPWEDSAQRFSLFCHAVSDIATGKAGIRWQPDLVHCNDWQTGLIPPLLHDTDVGTVFTIHNLAYQGLFDRDTFNQLNLPPSWWAVDAMEFYNQFSFIKGGLVYADMINTVSPNYAREICTEAFGCGLDSLLRDKKQRLMGILNGIDAKTWDPRHDLHIPHPYGLKNIQTKYLNKKALQKRFGLSTQDENIVIGNVGRIAEQKGLDLILSVLPKWKSNSVQFVFLGSGDAQIEKKLTQWQQQHPQSMALTLDYNEELAHQIEAGADIFVMPSRFEPCGLNQLYSLRYGTLPVVHSVGGLADTVVDESYGDNATGFVFNEPSAESLNAALTSSVRTFHRPERWRQMMQTAMKQDFSWKNSAKQYLQLYRQAMENRKSGQLN